MKKHKNNQTFYNASCKAIFILLAVAYLFLAVQEAGVWLHTSGFPFLTQLLSYGFK